MYLEKLKLDGEVAVVTGGGRAIGLACVTALAEAGAKVVIADVDLAVAASGQAELHFLASDADRLHRLRRRRPHVLVGSARRPFRMVWLFRTRGCQGQALA